MKKIYLYSRNSFPLTHENHTALNVKKTYYLGSNFRFYKELSDRLGAFGLNVDLAGNGFHTTLEKIEADFLRFSHKLNKRLQSLELWTSQLASRNSAGFGLFRDLVYAMFAIGVVCDGNEDQEYIFFCENVELLRVLEKKFSKQHKIIVSINIKDRISEKIVYLKLIWRISKYIIQFNHLWFLTRFLGKRKKPGQKEITILRSWFSKEGFNSLQYKDRNFGNLIDFLECQKISVWISPIFFSLDRSMGQAVRFLRKSSFKNFLFPERYVSWFSSFKVLFVFLKSFLMPFNGEQFLGLEIVSLLKQHNRATSFLPDSMHSCLFNEMLSVFARQGITVERLIYPFENNPVEKILIIGSRKSFPNARILGFQHVAWYTEQLGMKLDFEESKFMPLPDKIICSGSKYVEILKKCGFPEAKLVDGPSLRFRHINRENILKKKIHNNGKKNTILIVLNFDSNQNFELLNKINTYLRDFSSVFQIKLHPSNNPKELIGYLKEMRFPNYSFVEGKVVDLALKSHAVFMTAGSISNLEVMAHGVPLIRVSLGSNFNFDPLWGIYPLKNFLFDEKEVVSMVNKIVKGENALKKRLNEFGEKIVDDYFGKNNNERLKVFIEN
jgi:surface carbohydrate biosynthesis protein (TIGR04326 family)